MLESYIRRRDFDMVGEAKKMLYRLDPEKATFEAFFITTCPDDSSALYSLGSYAENAGEATLWKQLHACLVLALRGNGGHIDGARDCVRVLRVFYGMENPNV